MKVTLGRLINRIIVHLLLHNFFSLPLLFPPSLPPYLHSHDQVPDDHIGATCAVAPPKRLPSCDPTNCSSVPTTGHRHAHPGLDLLKSSSPAWRGGGEGRSEIVGKREEGRKSESRPYESRAASDDE